MRVNSFSTGERQIGSVSSRAECVAKVKSECPGFDLANVNHGSVDGCWCQKSKGVTLPTADDTGSAYDTCRVVALPTETESDEVEGQCMGDWFKTNYFGSGERSVGPVQSRAECINKVRSDCPAEFDLANMAVSETGTGCWCQKSNGEQVAPHTNTDAGYQTCRVKPLPGAPPATNDTAVNNNECLGPWVKTNAFGSGERSVGPV